MSAVLEAVPAAAINGMAGMAGLAGAPVALDDVLARPDVWRGDRMAIAPAPVMPTGFDSLDRELSGGWPRGALTELLLDGVGVGELTLLLPALASVKALGGWSLLVAPPYAPHAPALAAAGVDLGRLAVVSPAQPTDALWATEQALRSGSPAAVLTWAERLDPRQVRRLQVAAAGSQALAFLCRPAAEAAQASVAPLRLRLAAAGEGRLRLDVLKRRGPPLARPLSLILPRPAAWRDHAPVVAHAFRRTGAPVAGAASAVPGAGRAVHSHA